MGTGHANEGIGLTLVGLWFCQTMFWTVTAVVGAVMREDVYY